MIGTINFLLTRSEWFLRDYFLMPSLAQVLEVNYSFAAAYVEFCYNT